MGGVQKQKPEVAESRAGAKSPQLDRLNEVRGLDFEEGVREMVKRVLETKQRPVLIAVYGWPNSGKTKLIEEVIALLENAGLTVSNGEGALSPLTFDMLRQYGLYYGEVLLFHCAWDRTKKGMDERRDYEDPNALAEDAGDKINLNVGIYNPDHGKPEMSGEYDLMIRNPYSAVKPGSEAL